MSTDRTPDHPAGLPATDACDGCALLEGRRHFLRQVSLAMGGIALALLGRPAHAGEMAIRYAGAVAATATTATYALPEQDGATIDEEREVIVVRWSGAIYAFALSCPHQRALLKWKEKDARFQCPKHKSKYAPDGSFISGKATRGMDRYALRRQGTSVVVDLEKLYKQDEQAAQWAAAVVRA